MNETTVQVDRMVSILYGASVKKRIKRRDGVVRVANFLSDTATFVYDEGPDDIKRVIAEFGYHRRGELFSSNTTKEAR